MEDCKQWFLKHAQPPAGARGLNFHHCLYVKISEQKLYLFKDGKLAKTYPVGTGRNPPSCVNGSLGTPLGWHEVCEKIGGGAPKGTVFKGRKPAGYLYENCPPCEREKCLITSRILRLKGLEEGKNLGGDVDTFARYVYIHGTNREESVPGRPSHGCVVLKNADIIELFDAVEEGARVYIEQ